MLYNQDMKTKKSWALIIITALLFLLGLWTRVYKITSLPVARQYDELVYVLNAQAAVLSGTNLNDDWTLWSFQPVMPMYSELTTTMLMPWLQLGLPIKIASFLPFIVMSLLSPILIGLIVYELTKNKKAAYLTWVIALFNPFIWQFGRLGFDSVWSFFFYLWGSWWFLRFPRWKKLWALLPFTLGFYQYQGHKALLPFLVMSLTFYQVWPLLMKKNWQKWTKWRPFLPEFILAISAVILTGSYILLALPKQTNLERTSTLLSPESEMISERISQARLLTLEYGLKDVWNNKYVFTIMEIGRRILGSYKVESLFWSAGESDKMFYVVSNYGIMHLLDLILIVLGGVYLVQTKNKRLGITLVFLLLAATAPTWIADGEWYFYRAAWRVVPLLIAAGLGATWLADKGQRWQKWLFGFIYGVGIIYFASLYYFYLPLKSAADPFFADRILSVYLEELEAKNPVQLMVNDHRVTWMTFVYESGGLNQDNLAQAKKNWQTKEIAWNNLTFGPNCFDPEKVKMSSASAIISYDYRGCDDNAKSVKDELKKAGIAYKTIRSPIDNGEKYFIINDQVCEDTELANPLIIKKWESLEFGQLTKEEFCHTWISAE